MKLHRFFVRDIELDKTVWVNEQKLLHQWQDVLRFKVGNELVLFDGGHEERLYKIDKIGTGAVRLQMITELEKQLPAREVYLFFSLLKKDKNDWILQKCTELGVSHFVPILSSRTEKTGFDVERANKIVIEASEQCGRSDIPRVREPITLISAVDEFEGKIKLYYAEQSDEGQNDEQEKANERVGIFVGPEGGWTDEEKELLGHSSHKLNLAQFTLRSETANIIASGKILSE